MKQIKFLSTVLICVLCLAACKDKDKEQQPVNGVLEETVTNEVPDAVKNLMTASVNPSFFECVFNDEVNHISVWSLMSCGGDISSEGFGVKVCCGDTVTLFPEIRHGRQPKAFYDAEKKQLWFIGADMDGTGVQVERPYILQMDDNGKANILCTIDPFEIQQQLCQHLTYIAENNTVSFFVDGQLLGQTVSKVTDMGGFDDDAVWIGE